MALFRVTNDTIERIQSTSFAELGIQERRDIQRLLSTCIDVIAPDTMIVTDEFSGWVESSRRIDLLALHKSGDLVVIELKRTDDGGHMELQAIRYAAMVSTMTFEQTVEAHRKYLKSKDIESGDAEGVLLKFLGTEQPTEFNSSVRIVLASADFSKEITSTVLWLNDQGLDIRCVRLRPHANGNETLLDVQQVIPLPEAAEFQVAIQLKASERRAIERAGRDYTKYRLTIGTEEFEKLNKRRFILQIVKEAIKRGMKPEQIIAVIPSTAAYLFISRPGNVSTDAFIDEQTGETLNRYFTDDQDLFRVDGKTYALTNQWGQGTERCVKAIVAAMPGDKNINYDAIASE